MIVHVPEEQESQARCSCQVPQVDWDAREVAKGWPCAQAHYTTLLRLKQYFPFSLIDAMGTLEECRAQIARELRYQSSLDLDEATYAAIRHLPLAKDLVRASRQQLVAHLDGYAKRHKELFERVCWPRPAALLLPLHFSPTKASYPPHQEPVPGQGVDLSSQAAAAGSSGPHTKRHE